MKRVAIGSPQDLVWTDDAPYLTCDRQWEVVGHGRGYILRLVQVPIMFEFLHVRRERGDLFGQLRVLSDLGGTRSFEGSIGAPGTFNLSSPTARKSRAALLAELSRAPQIDWHRLLEEFASRVLTAEAEGDPAVWLHDVKEGTAATHLDVDGLEMTRKHANMLFGESDTLKSWTLLYILGTLAQRGIPVALLDWELDEEAYAGRSRRLFGTPPPILYLPCRKPLTLELDRIQREFHRHQIAFTGLDSVVPACGSSNPNDAEAPNQLVGALRQLAVGSLLVAHVPKAASEHKGHEKPFGSQFWFALCRSIWFVARTTTTEPVVTGFYHRKSSLSKLRPSVGLSWTFEGDSGPVCADQTNLTDVAELADRQHMWERMRDLLGRGPKTQAEVVELLGVKADTVKKAVQRGKMFTRITGTDGITRLALAERRQSA